MIGSSCTSLSYWLNCIDNITKTKCVFVCLLPLLLELWNVFWCSGGRHSEKVSEDWMRPKPGSIQHLLPFPAQCTQYRREAYLSPSAPLVAPTYYVSMPCHMPNTINWEAHTHPVYPQWSHTFPFVLLYWLSCFLLSHVPLDA